MLTEFLRSFTLPGLEKKYIVADDSLTEEGAAADSKKVGQELAKKVDKETGKALSTNDYTNAEKTKLAGVDSGAQVNTIEGVKVDGTEVTPDAQKKVNLNVYDKAAINAIVQEIYAEVAKKLNIDGYSELATVGNALGLVTDSVVEDKEPYNYRSLAHLPVGKFCYDTIVGGSVVWNQLMPKRTVRYEFNDCTVESNGDGRYIVTVLTDNYTGHTDNTVSLPASAVTPNHVYLWLGQNGGIRAYLKNYYKYTNSIFKPASSLYSNIAFYFTNVPAGTYDVYLQFIDLTAAVTPLIADYIYSLETATAGAGVAWFKKYFPKEYYAYCEPHFEHVQTSAKETVGFNQWDEEWEVGSFNDTTGAEVVDNSVIRAKNYFPVLSGTEYYAEISGKAANLYFYDGDKNYIGMVARSGNGTFTTPSNARYMRFRMNVAYGTTYNHDICINIHGDRDGEYEPYKKRTYPLDSSLTLRGIPKLDSANRLYFDGDVMRHDGSGEYRYDLVDLGTLTWTRLPSDNIYLFFANLPVPTPYAYNTKKADINVQGMFNYTYKGTSGWSYMANGTFGFLGSSMRIRDDSYTDATSFKTAMSGVYLLYERATPEPFTAEPFQSPMVVDPLGTEQFVDYGVEEGDRDVKIPCGHTSEYPEDLVDKLEVLPHATGTNGDFLITEIDGKLYLKPYTQTVGLTSVSGTEAE